ncbi:hypothetical protein [Rhizobium rhizogenes]|uniref:hypothetical protein n=1 Tax=Rhizobium rhizogenes TaxID=359 RepID=UPI0015734E19|nr:hypothetical protein [Rhizobium rhizogenes]NTF43320.1 hypothetical protein [Rhizobium rhizogenes]
MDKAVTESSHQPAVLKGKLFWLMLVLHLFLVPFSLFSNPGLVFPILFLVCVALTTLLRASAVTWVMSAFLGKLDDPKANIELLKMEERPWFPILLLEFAFGLRAVLENIFNGTATGSAKYLSIICVIGAVCQILIEYFRRVRFK